MVMSMNQSKKIRVFEKMPLLMISDHRLSYRAIHKHEIEMKKKERK